MICEVSYKLRVTTNRAWLVCAFNQEKALIIVGAFSMVVKTDGLFAALVQTGDCSMSLQIESDEADMAVQGFSFTYARAQVAVLQPAVSYLPYYWWTR